MHLEVLVEDQSGKRLLDTLIPKLIGHSHTFRVHAYKGIGRIPKGLTPNTAPSKRILLDQLPRLLQGYGNAYYALKGDQKPCVAVVCDLDDRNQKSFRRELNSILEKCNKKPSTLFCFAIEEGEAWLLGDKDAVLKAYQKANKSLLNSYQYDSICGTWERLADIVYPGGASSLSSLGWQVVGHEKYKWAENIGEKIEVAKNLSPSFLSFRDKLRAHGY